jgi:hypothetical protein
VAERAAGLKCHVLAANRSPVADPAPAETVFPLAESCLRTRSFQGLPNGRAGRELAENNRHRTGVPRYERMAESLNAENAELRDTMREVAAQWRWLADDREARAGKPLA